MLNINIIFIKYDYLSQNINFYDTLPNLISSSFYA